MTRHLEGRYDYILGLVKLLFGHDPPHWNPPMTPDNFDHTLQAFRDRSPFRPFAVVLHSGRQFEVDQPGALVQRDGVAIFIGPGGIPVVFDHEGVEQFAGDLADRSASA